MPSSRASSWPRDTTHSLLSPALAGGFFTTSASFSYKSCKFIFSHSITWGEKERERKKGGKKGRKEGGKRDKVLKDSYSCLEIIEQQSRLCWMYQVCFPFYSFSIINSQRGKSALEKESRYSRVSFHSGYLTAWRVFNFLNNNVASQSKEKACSVKLSNVVHVLTSYVCLRQCLRPVELLNQEFNVCGHNKEL